MTSIDPRTILRQVFGYDSFRGQQEAVIRRVVSGAHALVLMPTGGGKSLCYQIPAMVRDGVGIVVSPLIALMQDQVQALVEAGVRAAFVNSTLPPAEARAIEQDMVAGAYDLVYVAPERLHTPNFLARLQETELALFAVDEAHCLSQWGHDFRPEYRKLDVIAERFGDVPRIALTATADEKTRDEIRSHLKLSHADVFVSGFDRPNIHYAVVTKSNANQQLLQFLRSRHDGESGIVYCMSRKKVETVASQLQERGIEALPYHAGLDKRLRRQNQQRFVTGEGIVVVATIAFGMGIDKPNVRFVAHLDLPKSIEAYYQETGRAGRDGLPADAWMCYGYGDAVLIRQMVERSESAAERKRVEHQKLGALLGYCESASCRRGILLRYFGEAHEGECGNCDVCTQPVETFDGTTHAQKALSNVYRTGQRFGASYLADVLVGKTSDRLARFGHDRVSTFGIGTELDRAGWISVYRQLVAAGMLEVEPEHGGLSLAPEASPLLKGERSFRLRRDAAPGKRSASSTRGALVASLLGSPEEERLFEALREKRLDLARAQSVPPYVIFHDSTLVEMAKEKPQDHEALRAIGGVGATKLEKYGDAFLEVLRG